MDPTFVQNVHALLEQSTSPDTAAIKAATDALNNQVYKNPQCVPALFEIAASSPAPQVRQLAAVELRKRVSASRNKMWLKQAEDVRNGIKARLLEIILKEEVKLVRHSTARVISSIARIELPQNTWPDLLPFLYNATNSPAAAHREIGVFVLFTLVETIAQSMQAQLPHLFKLFNERLTDPESLEVRVTTVRALGVVAEHIEPADKNDIATFQSMLPTMVQVLHQSLEADDEDSARKCFDVFETLLVLEAPLVSKHITDMVEYFVTCGGNTNYDDALRVMALNSLLWTCKYKKQKVQTLGLAKPIIERMFAIGAEEDPEDVDEDSPSRLALRVLDCLATSLPPQQVFAPLLELMRQYMSSADPRLRKSAMMCFGVSVEGCSEYIRPLMKDLWPFVDAGLQDPEAIVRKAACIALGCLCEMLDEECAARHAVLLPLVINLMNDADTQRSACTALDSLLEVLGDDIVQYLPMLMERLVGLLETAPPPVKGTVTGAIGSAAHASKEQFQPYFQQTITRLIPFLSLTKEGEEQDLRGIATDTIGTLSEAVGKEAFRPYFSEIMKYAFEGMQLESPRLRECSFIFFAVMSRVFGEEFAPYLEHVVPALISSCQQKEHEDLPGGDDAGEPVVVEEDDGDGDFVDTEDWAEKVLSINSAVAIEKEVAADSLGELFRRTKQHFLPYLTHAVPQLVNLTEHYYEGIRKSALSALFTFLNTFYELSNPQQWQPGANVKVPLDKHVQELAGTIMPAAMELWENEDDKTVVISLCQDLAECMNTCGPGIVAPTYLEPICNHVIELLEQKAICQQDPDADESEVVEGEDQAEFDSVLISAASDLVGAMASVLGPDFAQAFPHFLPQLTKYYSKGRSLSDRSTAIGSIGEVITGMKEGITQFTEPLLEIISRALSDDEAEVRSNAAFAAGVLVQNSGADLSGHYMALLGALRPFFERAPEETTAVQTARDNAAGAVARLVMRNPNALPLDQVLPVFFSALPLKQDFAEYEPTLDCIFKLIQSENAVALQNIDHILQLFAHVLAPAQADQLSPALRGKVVEFISYLNTAMPDKVQAAGLQPYLV